VDGDVALSVEQRFVAAPAVGHQRDLVAHRA
jgi:hypothetical protein